MGFTKPSAVVLALCAAAPVGVAAPAAELADLAARIEYGFYGDEPRVIEAARASLERLAEDDAQARYYLAFGAFRLAQLDAQRGREPSGALVDSCVDGATPAADGESAEAWVLVGACASLGGEGRRRDHALGRARALDPKNPRIALLEAWAISMHPAGAEPAVRDAAAAHLEKSIEAFEVVGAPAHAADWGEPEALVQLGEIALARGEARAARDLLERALLLAPDYSVAVELRGKLQGGSRSR
jgi:tetratricopeptide (TPR) repeat protein